MARSIFGWVYKPTNIPQGPFLYGNIQNTISNTKSQKKMGKIKLREKHNL
jgi:hypothetical protein